MKKQTMKALSAITGAESVTLLAIPFFVCAGVLMNYTGVTKRIMDFCAVLTGRMYCKCFHWKTVYCRLWTWYPALCDNDVYGVENFKAQRLSAFTERKDEQRDVLDII